MQPATIGQNRTRGRQYPGCPVKRRERPMKTAQLTNRRMHMVRPELKAISMWVLRRQRAAEMAPTAHVAARGVPEES